MSTHQEQANGWRKGNTIHCTSGGSALQVLGLISLAVFVGVAVLEVSNRLAARKVWRKLDNELDHALEASMDCSDATAKY